MSRLSFIYMFLNVFILLFLSAAVPKEALATPITSDTLIESCRELVSIYNKKGEQRFLAGLSTSVAEAMRAGICRGMIEEHANHSRCLAGWHTMAKSIAMMEPDLVAKKPISGVEWILGRACGN